MKIEKAHKKKNMNIKLKNQHLLMKFTDPVIYNLDKNEKNIRSTDFDNVSVAQDEEQITWDAKEITT
ncbi:MAG: hypothetical protein WCB31_10225 [Nitrososphaeraceae archaeon]